MDEEGFHIFAVIGVVVTVIALVFIRHFEDNMGRTQNRLSTVIWFFFLASIGLGLVNMSGSYLLVSVVGLVSLIFAFRSWNMRELVCEKHQKLWVVVSFVPFSGWLFHYLQFPHLHSLDAQAARLNGNTVQDP